MGTEKKLDSAQSEKPVELPSDPPVEVEEEISLLEQWADIHRLRRELESGEAEELELEPVDMTDEQMEALSEEELDQHIDLLEKRVKVAELQKELDRRALNMGLLKLADRAPRCSHLKSNGKPCRAPAMGNRQFCVFPRDPSIIRKIRR